MIISNKFLTLHSFAGASNEHASPIALASLYKGGSEGKHHIEEGTQQFLGSFNVGLVASLRTLTEGICFPSREDAKIEGSLLRKIRKLSNDTGGRV